MKSALIIGFLLASLSLSCPVSAQAHDIFEDGIDVWHVEGYVFVDDNSNQKLDPDETTLPNIQVHMKKADITSEAEIDCFAEDQNIITDQTGFYFKKVLEYEEDAATAARDGCNITVPPIPYDP